MGRESPNQRRPPRRGGRGADPRRIASIGRRQRLRSPWRASASRPRLLDSSSSRPPQTVPSADHGSPPASAPGPARTGCASTDFRPPAAWHASQPPQLVEHLVQPLPLDELHGVVVHALLLADAEDRHDVGVVQPGRRAGLEPEPLQVRRASQAVLRQDLQAPRAGPATAARPRRRPPSRPGRSRGGSGSRPVAAGRARPRLQPHRVCPTTPGHRATRRLVQLELDQAGKSSRISPASSGYLSGVLFDAGPLAGAEPGDERVGQPLDRVAVEG